MRTVILLLAFVAPVDFLAAQERTATAELVPNPTLKDDAQGWRLTRSVVAADLKHDGSDCVRLKAFDSGAEDFSEASVGIAQRPRIVACPSLAMREPRSQVSRWV